MRPIKTFAALLLLALLVLTSCGGPTSEDYFPLKKGYVWTYSIDNGAITKTVENFESRKLEKTRVIPQRTDIAGKNSFIFLSETGKGIIAFAAQAPDATEPAILENQEYVLKNPFSPGTSWDRQVKTTLMMEVLPLTLTFTVADKKETVTVPAGTFEKCVKVVGKGYVEKDKGLMGLVRVTVVQQDWYAPGVGLIKSVTNKSGNHMLIQPEESTVQLTGYKK